jgi:hypothetical protein
MTTSDKVEHLLAFFGALVPLMSALASYLNHKVRVGDVSSPVALKAAAALNVGALNLDKAMQLAKIAQGRPVPETESKP